METFCRDAFCGENFLRKSFPHTPFKNLQTGDADGLHIPSRHGVIKFPERVRAVPKAFFVKAPGRRKFRRPGVRLYGSAAFYFSNCFRSSTDFSSNAQTSRAKRREASETPEFSDSRIRRSSSPTPMLVPSSII